MNILRAMFHPWADRDFRLILEILGTLMSKIDDLTTAVANENTVIASAEALLTTLSTDLQNALNSGTDGAVQAVIDGITAKTTELAAAVTANTPAADPAPAGQDGTGVETAAATDAGTTGQ